MASAAAGSLMANCGDTVFKNLMLYRLAPDWAADLATVETALDALRFVECGATQTRSAGWVPPRAEAHAALVEAIAGQWLMQLQVETKQVPGAVLRRRVDALAAQVEKATGRKPGKTERRDLKDQAQLDLLPQAFAKQRSHRVWIDRDARLLLIDAGSSSHADEVITALTQALPGLSGQPIHTARSPSAAMAEWLSNGEPPDHFTVDRDCELKAADGERAVVRYARHALDTDEVRAHVLAGKHPTRLALTWRSRVSLVLTEQQQVKKLAFLDGVFEGRPDTKGFDADAAIATGELAPLLADLLLALGGEAAPP